MKNMKKTVSLFGISCLLMGIIVAPFAFFFTRSLESVEVATFSADETFQTADKANYTTYQTSNETISCQDQDGNDIDLFQGHDSNIAFTSDDFIHRVHVTCNADITAFEETSPRALHLTSGLFLASPILIGIGIWTNRQNRKFVDSN